MGKPIEARISYHTRKVVEHFSTHVTKRHNRYRQERLMAYKKEMDMRIDTYWGELHAETKRHVL